MPLDCGHHRRADLAPSRALAFSWPETNFPSRESYLAMKSRLAILIFLVVLSLASLAPAQTPVVVELFTSEGCSSCPPADALLVKLSQQGVSNGAPLMLLGEHVDYWNYIGWTDRFSSKQFSQRQSEYGRALSANVYTPEMVIDGDKQFVGSDASQAQREIAAAAKETKPAQVTLHWEGKQSAACQRAVASAGARHGAVGDHGRWAEHFRRSWGERRADSAPRGCCPAVAGSRLNEQGSVRCQRGFRSTAGLESG